jgi:YVTN family beta-propeller protein
MKSRNTLAYAIVAAIGVVSSFSACNPDDSDEVVKIKQGLFIVNEGAYGSSNGCISYYNPETDSLQSDLFLLANGRSAGDVLQSFTIANDTLGIIVANNSGKIEIVNMSTFKTLCTPIAITYPRYVLQVNSDKAYITSGSHQGQVSVLNLRSLSVSSTTIPTGFGPEHMAKSGNYVFVANSGGWEQDSTLTIINAETDKVEKTLVVGENPINICTDNDNNVWVLCKGSYAYDANWNTISGNSTLVKVNAKTLTVEKTYSIGTKGDSFLPTILSVSADGQTLYYVEIDGIYSFSLSTLKSTKLVKGSFYGMGISPKTNDIYGLKSTGFTTKGYMHIYDDNGIAKHDSILVGIGPNSVVFNY